MLGTTEFREYHERVAARLRLVAEGAQESSLKAGLLQRAERHEQLAISDMQALAQANGLDWHAGEQWLREAAAWENLGTSPTRQPAAQEP